VIGENSRGLLDGKHRQLPPVFRNTWHTPANMTTGTPQRNAPPFSIYASSRCKCSNGAIRGGFYATRVLRLCASLFSRNCDVQPDPFVFNRQIQGGLEMCRGNLPLDHNDGHDGYPAFFDKPSHNGSVNNHRERVLVRRPTCIQQDPHIPPKTYLSMQTIQETSAQMLQWCQRRSTSPFRAALGSSKKGRTQGSQRSQVTRVFLQGSAFVSLLYQVYVPLVPVDGQRGARGFDSSPLHCLDSPKCFASTTRSPESLKSFAP
jgi:hypothetical protein